MKRERRLSAAAALAAAVFAIATCAIVAAGRHSAARHPSPPGENRQVRRMALANRTIEVAVHEGEVAPGAFPDSASARSRRGTSVFALVSRDKAGKSVREAAAGCGARVIGTVAPYGLVVEADGSALARLRKSGKFLTAVEYGPQDKISRSLSRLLSEAGADDAVAVNILPLAVQDAPFIASHVAAAGFKPQKVESRGMGRVTVTLPRDMVAEIAERGDVRWIERYSPLHLMNDVAVRPGLMNVTPVRETYGLAGSNQTVTVSDSGLDTGDKRTVMADFAGRVQVISTLPDCCSSDLAGHGTHVAGSIAGNGALSGGQFKGVAPEAKLNVWQIGDSSGNVTIPNDIGRLFQINKRLYPSYIHSASWGGNGDSEYDSLCIEFDEWLWNNPENLGVFAAGNDNSSLILSHIMSSPAGAKNVLAVGATESLRPDTIYRTEADNPSSLADFSSTGPMEDGRIKPDVCAPGTMIISTLSTVAGKTELNRGPYTANTNYTYCSGTSMATPLVSGTAAIARQWLMEKRGFTNELPTAALMKAVLAGGAYDMSADSGANCGGAAPNSWQGWGRVDLGESIFPSNKCVKLVDRIPFADGETFSASITTTNDGPLCVQLAWTDYPGDVSAAQSLVNDLDLVVSNETTGAVWYGNGVEGGDRTNNMESVRIASAPAGIYSISVKGENVLYGSTEGGAAALYAKGVFSEEDAGPETETVSLTVHADGGGYVFPGAGTHRITKGVTVRLYADAIEDSTNAWGTVTSVRDVAGWSGTGDVPATGSDTHVSVTFTQDSSITWRWKETGNVLLRTYPLLSSRGAEYWPWYWEEWPLHGSTVDFSVPESIPGGSEELDITVYGLTYTDGYGRTMPMTVQKLGHIEVAETDEDDGLPVTDSSGRMATEFSLVMDGSKDVLFKFYDVADTNAAKSLPQWWYRRYAEDDPDAGTVRFVSVSPGSVEWTGAPWDTRILERTEDIGNAGSWLPVYTNFPAAVLTNSWAVPAEYSTNSFFRITGRE